MTTVDGLDQLPVVLLPSLGRPASDFDQLADDLSTQGFSAVPIELSLFTESMRTFDELAHAVVAELDRQSMTSFHLLGHAFGNRLARQITALYRDRVQTLMLLACGGSTEMEPDILRAFQQCFEADISDADRVAAVGVAFFADPTAASVWTHGWDGSLALQQRHALSQASLSDWWDAVTDRVLVVQGLDDAIAPPANGRKYASDHPEVTLVELPRAGHALLPELPKEIAATVLNFLRS
jgi:pimeloyl-ACP methyl ester carboxylesterase